MTRILVIRHAPTAWNAEGRLQGRADEPLSAAGRASLAGARLPDEWRASACLASPLRRAMETAQLLGLAPVPEPRLVEMDWGAWEGRRLADLRAEHGAAMAANEASGLDFRPPAGESPREVQARLAPLLASLAASTVLVTHKGVLRALYALATGWTMREKPADRLADGTAHLFSLKGGSPHVERLNLSLGGDAA